MKYFITTFYILIQFQSVSAATSYGPKCEIEEGVGIYIDINEENYGIKDLKECFMFLQVGLYSFLTILNDKSNLGWSIPVKYTDLNGDETKCKAHYQSNDFKLNSDTESIQNMALQSEYSNNPLRVIVDYHKQNNKEGLDKSIPIICDFLGV